MHAELYEVILHTLKGHRLQHTHCEGDNGGYYPLIDAVAPKGDPSIQRGHEELELLAEAIAQTVLPLRAAMQRKDDELRRETDLAGESVTDELLLSRAEEAEINCKSLSVQLAGRTAECEALRVFSGAMLFEWEDADCDCVSTEKLEAVAVVTGLLESVTVTEACGKFCSCVDDRPFPKECIRYTEWGRAAVEEANSEMPPHQ